MIRKCIILKRRLVCRCHYHLLLSWRLLSYNIFDLLTLFWYCEFLSDSILFSFIIQIIINLSWKMSGSLIGCETFSCHCLINLSLAIIVMAFHQFHLFSKGMLLLIGVSVLTLYNFLLSIYQIISLLSLNWEVFNDILVVSLLLIRELISLTNSWFHHCYLITFWDKSIKMDKVFSLMFDWDIIVCIPQHITCNCHTRP